MLLLFLCLLCCAKRRVTSKNKKQIFLNYIKTLNFSSGETHCKAVEQCVLSECFSQVMETLLSFPTCVVSHVCLTILPSPSTFLNDFIQALLPSQSLDQKLTDHTISLQIKFKKLCFVFSNIHMHIHFRCSYKKKDGF